MCNEKVKRYSRLMEEKIIVGASRDTNPHDKELKKRWWNEVLQIYDKNIN